MPYKPKLGLAKDAHKTKKLVIITCRAEPKGLCDGREAELISSRKRPGGGRTVRYRCTKCNRMFQISS